MPNHWTYYFQGSRTPICCCTWFGSMCKVNIAFQELQAIALMLCKMAFHLDNIPVKAHLCNQGGTASLFLCRVGCHILNPSDKHGIILIPTCIPTHLNVEADYLSGRKLFPEWYLLPCIAWAAFHLVGQPEVDLLESSCTTQCLQYCILENPLLFLEALGLNAFNHPWAIRWIIWFLHAWVLLVLSKCLVKLVAGQFRLLILVAPCWMEDPWLLTDLNTLADIPHQCPIIKGIVMDVLGDPML